MWFLELMSTPPVLPQGGVAFATSFAVPPHPSLWKSDHLTFDEQTIQSLKTRALGDVLESLDKIFLISPAEVESPWNTSWK
jgi:hypothetical protein